MEEINNIKLNDAETFKDYFHFITPEDEMVNDFINHGVYVKFGKPF